MHRLLLWVIAECSVRAATAFDIVHARAFAALTEASYCGPEPGLLTWSCGPCETAGFQVVPGTARFVEHRELSERNSTFAYISRIKALSSQWVDGCAIAWRGSKTVTNWVYDFEAWHSPVPFEWCEGCHVENGFYSVLKYVMPDLLANLTDIGCAPNTGSSLYITGHSLGAAVSHVAMALLDMQGYNVQLSHSFESPRVGDKTFAAVFDHEWKKRNVPVYRITHSKDPAVHVPFVSMGYWHVNQEVFFPNQTDSYIVCSATEDPTCSNQYPFDKDILDGHDHCTLALGTKGSICSCILNETVASGSIVV